MVRFENLPNGAVARRDKRAAAGFDGYAIANDLLGEDDVWDIFDVDDFAGNRGDDFDRASVIL